MQTLRSKAFIILLAAVLLAVGCAACSAPEVVVATPEITPTPTPTPSPTPTPVPTPTPEPTPTPDPFDKYFTHDGSTVVQQNEEKTYWLYRDGELSVEINKYRDDGLDITYLVAEIYTRNYSLLKTGFAGGPGTQALKPVTRPDEIAQKYNAVFAMNADFFTEQSKGIVLREGTVLRDDPELKANTVYPGAYTLALMPDGELKIYSRDEITAQQLLDAGVTDTIAFGPPLVVDGQLFPELDKASNIGGNNPRSGIGMVEPGHYIGIVVDGRKPGYSRGLKLHEFAQLFIDNGCTMAYNFDGGQSSAMVFMGEAINTHPKTEKWKNGQRRVSDIFYIGTYAIVPEATAPAEE